MSNPMYGIDKRDRYDIKNQYIYLCSIENIQGYLKSLKNKTLSQATLK